MKIIAIEEHFWYPKISDRTPIAQVFRDLKHPACDRLGDIGAGRIADMDRAGIDFQLLSHFDPGVQEFDTPDATALAREANDLLGEAIRANPTRLGGFATLATQEPENAARELERSVGTWGLKGAMINGHTHGEYLDDPKYWCIFEAAEALGVPLYLHPTTPQPDVTRVWFEDYTDEQMHLASWGFAVETGTHVLRLIYAGVFDRFPRLTMMLGHLGELLPFNMWRLDAHYQPTMWYRTADSTPPRRKLALKPSEYIRDRFYITTSGNFSNPPLLCALAEMGADRIMFATDYPIDRHEEAVAFLKNAPLSDSDRAKIAHLNAERVFGIPG